MNQQAKKRKVPEQIEEDESMSAQERRLLIEYLEKQGWTGQQIVDLLKYISR